MGNDNRQVGHMWAAFNLGTTTKRAARSNNGNFSFEGPRVHSYSTCIAQWLQAPDGTPWVLINGHRYSVTTSGKHMQAVRRAIPSHVRTITIDAGFPARNEWFNPPGKREVSAIVAALAQSAVDAQDRARKARTYKEHHLQAAESDIADAQFLATAYGVPFDDPAALLQSLRLEREGLAILANIGRCVADFLNGPSRLWANMESALASIDLGVAWLAGRDRTCHVRNMPTLLRVNGDTIETSMGAEFPLEHGIRALPFIERAVREGRAFAFTPTREGIGHTIRLGHFRVDSVSAAGWVQAGCHNVPHFAIRWAARQAGVIEAPELDQVARALAYAKRPERIARDGEGLSASA
jgi:hypothetical protein